jgi:Reverse transcriptase (RNA-dependent DNA polymerase)
LSSTNGYFASLQEFLPDPMEQKGLELDELERMLRQVTVSNKELFLHPFAPFASKSDPDTLMYHEAMMANDKQEFWDAMEVEIAVLEKQNTWTVVSCTQATKQGKKVIPGIWTFKRKQYPDGRIWKHKAQFCLLGDKQIIDVNVFDTYAPVVQWSSVCLCFILTIILGLSSQQVDYMNAFVQAKVKTPMFVELPKGFDYNTNNN